MTRVLTDGECGPLPDRYLRFVPHPAEGALHGVGGLPGSTRALALRGLTLLVTRTPSCAGPAPRSRTGTPACPARADAVDRPRCTRSEPWYCGWSGRIPGAAGMQVRRR
jgi:hypothetical protein